MSAPIVGSIVHYVLCEADGSRGSVVHDHRPAIVVNTHQDDTVHLCVFARGHFDRNDDRDCFRVARVGQDEEGKQPGSWHWPEREEEVFPCPSYSVTS